MRQHPWCEPRWVIPLLLALGLIGIARGCSTVQSRVQARRATRSLRMAFLT